MSLKTTESVTNNNVVIIPHPPYLPDLSPCDLALFPKLKMKLKRWHFETVSEGITSSTRQHSQCFWSMEKTMGSLYTFQWRLLWRSWKPILSKLFQHFFLDVARELLNSTSYCSAAVLFSHLPLNYLWFTVLYILMKCFWCQLCSLPWAGVV
jgi:hypothetical protein